MEPSKKANMTSSATFSVTGNFPISELTKITDRLTYATITKLQTELAENAVSVPCTLGRGNHGYLGLVYSAARYLLLARVAFVAPIFPGPIPVYAPAAAAQARAQTDREHKEQLWLYNEYMAMDMALKRCIIAAINLLFLMSQQDCDVGFQNLCPRDIIAMLYQQYGQITPAKLDANNVEMKTAYDVSEPIEFFFNRIQDCVDLADARNALYFEQQIVNTMFNLLEQSGLYEMACDRWRAQGNAYKNFQNLQQDFMAAYELLLQKTSTNQGQANNIITGTMKEETVDQETALDRLAAATEADCVSISNLTTANSALITQVSTSENRFHEASQEIDRLQAIVNYQKSQQGRGCGCDHGQNQGHGRGCGHGNSRRQYYYCWTHGPNRSYDSAAYTNRNDGHIENATSENPQGGA